MKKTGIKYLESGIYGVESGIQRLSFLSRIPFHGATWLDESEGQWKSDWPDEALQKSAFQSSVDSQSTLSTESPNPIFYLYSSRFVKKAEMETPVYILFSRQNKNNAM